MTLKQLEENQSKEHDEQEYQVVLEPILSARQSVVAPIPNLRDNSGMKEELLEHDIESLVIVDISVDRGCIFIHIQCF